MQNATCKGSDARQQADIERIRNAQDLRNRLGGGTSPDSLTRAATPLRIAEGRQPPALGSPGPCRKAEPCSAKVRGRLSFERVHDDQTGKDSSPNRAGEAATSAGCAEGCASEIIRRRRSHVEADAARLCPRVDCRP